MRYAMMGTWGFARFGLEAGLPILERGGTALDAVEAAVSAVEAEPSVDSVGWSGLPNCEGEVDADAAIMDGATLSMGAVANLSGFYHPVSVARAVMTKTPHTFMVGEGANAFAKRLGFEAAPPPTAASMERWRQEREKRAASVPNAPLPEDSHDTVGMIALDEAGHLAVATSTSGLFYKLPGRVGDSPLVGAGYYADDRWGAAVATGVGEEIMRSGLCLRAVLLMAQGLTPQLAAEAVVTDAHLSRSRAGFASAPMSILCMDPQGRRGAATNRTDFPFWHADAQTPMESRLRKAPEILDGGIVGPRVGV